MIELAFVLAGCSAVIGLAFVFFGIWYLRAVRSFGPPAPAPVTLILALTGDQPDLGDLFGALATQSFRARRLIIAVESPWDPAAAQAQALAAQLPFPMSVVIAGEETETAQKCANFAAAFRTLYGQDAAVVVFDGDIRPGPDWLGALVGPVLDGRFDIVTGYRWLMPGGGGPGAHLVAWLDRGVAILPKPPSFGVVWGGSTAYSRNALTQLDLPSLYAHQLLYDLSAGSKARALGLRLLTRRILLVRVSSANRGFAFYRRQFQFGWRYRPVTLAIGLLLALLSAAGWWAALGLVAHHWAGVALLSTMMAGRFTQWVLYRRVARVIDTPDPPAATSRQLAVALLAPFSALILPLLILAALPARKMEWRGIVYAIRGREAVRVIRRVPWEKPPPCPITGAPDSVRIGTISTTVLWRIWQHGLRTAPTPLRRGEQIGCWRSPVGLIFFHPMIAGDGAFYTSMYGRINVAEEFKRSAAKRPEFIEAARHIAPGAKVLEIGAGTGSFAQHLAPSVQYTGLDPHSADYASGHQMAIKTETLEAHLASHAGHYDVACAFQVIEHVPDPLGTARDMLRSLRPGGLLILVAPVWPSPMTRIPNFPINIPPHHLTCWNPTSMRALALAAGAEPVAVHTLPPGPHVGRILWMARLCLIKAPVNGPWVAARWSWVLSLIGAWLLAFPATWIRSSPPGTEPIDIMLVARKPLSAVPETSAGAEKGAVSGASPA